MRNLFLAFFLTLSLLLPAYSIAGQGSDVWYSAWFNDSDIDSLGGKPFSYRTWIYVTNPNSSPATLKIVYYQNDGTKFTDSNGNFEFTHTVAGNGLASWRPNADLQLTSTVSLQGSYIIIVTDGSVMVEENMAHLANTALGDTNYSVGSVASAWTKPLQTVTSTFLTMDFVQYDSNGDNSATLDGEAITNFNLSNPSDTMPAEATITFYDNSGNILAGPETLTFGAHNTQTFSAGQKGVNGSYGNWAKGSAIINVTKGSLVGCYAKHFCSISNTETGAKNYRSFGGILNKRLNIK